MNRLRVVGIGGAATALIVGMTVASASVGGSSQVGASSATARAQVISRIQVLEQRASAAGDSRALVALQSAERALQARPAAAAKAHGRPTSPPPPCPSSAPNAGGLQPCGNALGHGLVPPPCPSSAPNAGGLQPCGQPHATGSPTPTAAPSASGSATPAACGPADAGGTPAKGPISGPLYGIGVQVTNGGGAPLGDAVQQIACAVYTNLSL